MTLNELKKEVLSLNFDSELDSHEAFVFATNRALTELHSEHPRLEVKKIFKKRILPIALYERITRGDDRNITIYLNGKALSFTSVGKGELRLYDGGRQETISFSGAGAEIKRELYSGSAVLIFTGDGNYEIYNLASFDSLSGENADEVPVYSKFTKYDMKKIDPLFLAFTSPVTDENGERLNEAKLEGSVVTVPFEYEGELTISYRRRGKKVELDDYDRDLDVPPECEHLLALRCSSYLLFDGNEGLAEYYLSLYRSGINSLKSMQVKASCEPYRDVLGWA